MIGYEVNSHGDTYLLETQDGLTVWIYHPDLVVGIGNGNYTVLTHDIGK